MHSREEILETLKLFSINDNGIGSWISKSTNSAVFERLGAILDDPLTKTQINQLLTLGNEAPLSDGFFDYYWLSIPDCHPYDVTKLPHFKEAWRGNAAIESLDHLAWGLYRLYIDGLLWFGNVRSSYRFLRTKDHDFLCAYFSDRRYDTYGMKKRGSPLNMYSIPKDERFLISEMACKSYGVSPMESSDLKAVLLSSFENHMESGGGAISIRQLLAGKGMVQEENKQDELLLSASDVLEDKVEKREQVEKKYEVLAERFVKAREKALKNTELYLSMVGELDVYVATSMRTRAHFREMADTCEDIFGSEELRDFNVRYFDPTTSAAEGHEDKGLIECLMVKCAKALVYCAGKKDSYGKDAEAAMALSLGKPVIFYCDEERKQRFFREIHPLSRLIDFETGIAVGAMVTSSKTEVVKLLSRIFENKMEYVLEQSKPGYLRLKEKLTDSVVRLQTNDRLLTETFWNYYENK